jgi:hypothetical protein
VHGAHIVVATVIGAAPCAPALCPAPELAPAPPVGEPKVPKLPVVAPEDSPLP